ncbi:MAG: hypothetical protein ACRENA_10290, partial [Vulcanimicrobiaceae bacterium]
SSYNLDWTHGWRGGQLTIDAYRQNQSGQTINGYINALGEPPGYLPGGYLYELQIAWSQASVCGAASFLPVGFYVNQPISGTTRLYQGIDASARIQLGPNVVLLPTYALNVATLVAADARFAVPGSVLIVGSQLPGHPIHRAALTADVLVPKTRLELLLSGQYTGSNNNRELAPFTTVAAGLSHPLGPGHLTLFATNLFNTEAGTFSTLQFAQPIPLAGGGVTSFAAYPLPPRTYNISYTFALGKGATASSTLEEQAQEASRANVAPSEPGGPGSGTGMGGPGGPGSGTGGGRFRNVLPQGGDPFALARNANCTEQAQDTARPVLQMMRDYVKAYEARQPLPQTPNFTVTAHPGSTPPYWLDFEPTDLQSSPLAGRVRYIFACAYVAILTPQQAQDHGITTDKGVFFGYAPGVGIFRVLPRELPSGGGQVR